MALIYGKACGIRGIKILDKINNWEDIKGKSLWVNVIFTEQEQITDSKHFYLFH